MTKNFTVGVVSIAGLMSLAGAAHGQLVEVAGLNNAHAVSEMSRVPGGLPGFPDARYTNFGNKLYRTPTTNQWYTVATTNTGQGASDQVFVLGTGRSTQVLAQEGVTQVGTNPNTTLPEYLNFSTLSVPRMNDAGQYAIAFQPAGGGNTDQRMVTWDGTAFTVIRPGDPAPGNLYTGSFNSANITATGTTGFMASIGPVGATQESAVYNNALLIDMFNQAPTGQSTPTNSNWQDLDTNGLMMDDTGSHYIALGKVGLDTAIDQVLVVDGVVRVQEGSVLAGSGFTSPVSQLESVSNNGIWMEPDGTWFAMGRNADTTRWVVRNGVVIATSGAPVVPGSSEVWETPFRCARGSSNGHFVIMGNSSSAALTDDIIVVDGTTVVARESQPVDLDADGTADNSLYMHLMTDQMVLMSDGYCYFPARLKSDPTATTGVGGSTGSSLLRVLAFAPPSQCGPQDFNQDGDSGTDQDIEAFFACLGGNCCPACWPAGADFNGDGDVGTDQDIEAFFRVLGGGTC